MMEKKSLRVMPSISILLSISSSYLLFTLSDVALFPIVLAHCLTEKDNSTYIDFTIFK